jgi:hypothetical protein
VAECGMCVMGAPPSASAVKKIKHVLLARMNKNFKPAVPKPVQQCNGNVVGPRSAWNQGAATTEYKLEPLETEAEQVGILLLDAPPV